MNKKLKKILEELIKAYIKTKEPISSKALKNLAHLDISASTIRGYFQNLEKIGMLKKEHISSGSYPTIEAMDFFWRDYLTQQNKISIDTLNENCEKAEVFAYIKIFDNQLLREVYNVNNKFILLEFEDKEIVIKYQKEIFDLLNSLKMFSNIDLEKLSKRYKIDILEKNLKNFNKNIKINEKLLYNKFDNLNLSKLSSIDNIKVDYQNRLVIKKFSFSKENKDFEIYLIGDIYSDFLSLFDTKKGGKSE